MLMKSVAVSRRRFVTAVSSGLAIASIAGPLRATLGVRSQDTEPAFKISLAEWSLHRELQAGTITNLDFPKVAKELGIEAVEYVNSFFKDKAQDEKYLSELNKICDDLGVKQLLIMCDGEGNLGDPDDEARNRAVENHHRWVDAAKTLGCHSIRVNAASRGTYEEQMKLAADGLAKLAEYAASAEMNVIVENHGGFSSNGDWLSGVMKMVDKENCGTLPDFGNFRIQGEEWFDRYKGVELLMPFAKAVSAKSHQFDDNGNETNTDYSKMMKIVLDAGYHGYVGIEFEGGGDEREGIVATKKLLERCREELGT
ncbi:MAG: sugar phosphate isomerase/epimerase family protein [Pirellulaceae bacterium]